MWTQPQSIMCAMSASRYISCFILKCSGVLCSVCLVSLPLCCHYVKSNHCFPMCFHVTISPPVCIQSLSFHSFLVQSGGISCIHVKPSRSRYFMPGFNVHVPGFFLLALDHTVLVIVQFHPYPFVLYCFSTVSVSTWVLTPHSLLHPDCDNRFI